MAVAEILALSLPQRDKELLDEALMGLGTVTPLPTAVHPNHPATRVTFDLDGGITIESDVRITIRNTRTHDEVNYR